MWCYIFILTLLDISLNTKLSAQGKSHGITVHDSLVEGITFQEWGKETPGEGTRLGKPVALDALALSPPALAFGRSVLAAAHVRTVTITNTANTTMHLASVAGTTPDFHASFFDSKTLAPQANTTFSVVYLGRREGSVSAYLYIHTSLGVHKYPVSAVGVASEWGVWPLVGVRVPQNASVEPLLTMHNPTDQTIQVSEVYSSSSWLGLRLPDGGEAWPRQAWALPPHSTRAIVRLQLHPHLYRHQQNQAQQQHANQPLTAYVRIKANMTGGGLVVGVEASSVAPGEHLSPLQLRITARGSKDPPDMVEIEAGNSLNEGIHLNAHVWGSRCGPEPLAPPPPPPAEYDSPTNAHLSNGAQPAADRGTLNGLPGVRAEGVQVALLRDALDAHAPLTRVARLSIDHARLWAGYVAAAGAEDNGDGGEGAPTATSTGSEAWCAGWVRVGRAAMPYSLRLMPGTLALHPPALHFITADPLEALKQREVYVRNEFSVPVRVTRVLHPGNLDEHLDFEWATPLTLEGGVRALLGRVRLRRDRPDLTLDLNITIVTNLTDYTLPLQVYSGKLTFEWDWPRGSPSHLELGGVGTSSTRRVGVRLVNAGPAPLCVAELSAQLAGAQLVLASCAPLRHPPRGHPCRCVEPWRAAPAWLTVVAPAREGPLRGHATVATPYATTTAVISLHAHKGRLVGMPLQLYRAAPYAWSSAPLILESSMSLKMRVVNVTQPEPDPAVSYVPKETGEEISLGRHSVGSVVYAPDKLCAPHCYTGLDLHTPEGAAWAARAAAPRGEALAADAALHQARRALFAQMAHSTANISLHVHTNEVVQIPVTGSVQWWWPRLVKDSVAGAGGEGGVGVAGTEARLAGVGASVQMPLRVRNPSPTHRLLLQPIISQHKHSIVGSVESSLCNNEKCVWSNDAFKVSEWRMIKGGAALWTGTEVEAGNGTDPTSPLLLLEPDAEIEIKIIFAPKEASLLAAFLYLRNNLTITESVQLIGRGAYPSFEIAGRRPGTTAPLLFEVTDCGTEGDATLMRTVVVRNTGTVGVRLREWRIAGQPCQARGFSVQPCAPLTLAPNESRTLRLAFTADFTLARVPARLHLRADSHRAEFPLLGAAPARLLAACHARAPPPPFDGSLRTAASVLALSVLALVLAAATLDAERELRRARAARPPSPPRPPLDLRTVAHAPPPPPVPGTNRSRPAAKRRRPPLAVRRRQPPVSDPHAERRAFERWRAEVLRAAPEDEEDRSSEEADSETRSTDQLLPLDSETPEVDVDEEENPIVDGYEADPETEERPMISGDEDAISTGSGSGSGSSSTPADEREEEERDEADDLDEVDDNDDADESSTPIVSPNREVPFRLRTEPDLCLHTPVPLTEEQPRAAKVRRETSDTSRRSDRVRNGDGGESSNGRGRPSVVKHHARKDKSSKRRSERPQPSPLRDSPQTTGDCKAPGAVRWGASWSSVVAARGAAGTGLGSTPPGSGALAPIGSDVRRRADTETRVPSMGDNSLFFFNGEPRAAPRPDTDFAWHTPPPDECPAFTPAQRDFLGSEESVNGAAYRQVGGVWGGWGGWGVVRPPPGFGTPSPPVRTYDPFRSFASIWAPGAYDLRPETPSHHQHTNPPHPNDDGDDENNN